MQIEDNGESVPLILIYYKFRGQLQPIRNLLCYIQVPFHQVHLEYIEQAKNTLPKEIIKQVRKFKIDRSQLPAMVHGNIYAEGQEPICSYICKRFNRLELLGTNIYMRAKLRQILSLYVSKHAQSMIKMLEMVDKANKLNQHDFDEECKISYNDIFDNSKYAKGICEYLDIQGNCTYILGPITLIDFFFVQSCIYSQGICGTVNRLDIKGLNQWNPSKSNFLEKPNAYYMSVMTSYLERVHSQPWYQKHKDYLESFSIVSVLLSPDRVAGLRKAWIGNPKFVS